MYTHYRTRKQTGSRYAAVLVALVLLICVSAGLGQDIAPASVSKGELEKNSDFRTETIKIDGGAELITIFAKQSNFSAASGLSTSEMPLVSILKDTLGDDRAENDRLRFVWMLTYTRPSFWQRTAAFVPFLY